MLLEEVKSITFRKLEGIEELKQVAKEKDGRVTQEVNLFVWDEVAETLIEVNYLDFISGQIGNDDLEEFYDIEGALIFIVEDYQV